MHNSARAEVELARSLLRRNIELDAGLPSKLTTGGLGCLAVSSRVRLPFRSVVLMQQTGPCYVPLPSEACRPGVTLERTAMIPGKEQASVAGSLFMGVDVVKVYMDDVMYSYRRWRANHQWLRVVAVWRDTV